ncbi:unnamed protein product, partial [Musa hybrid cultivar]
MMVVHAGALLPPCNLHVGSDASSCSYGCSSKVIQFCLVVSLWIHSHASLLKGG